MFPVHHLMQHLYHNAELNFAHKDDKNDDLAMMTDEGGLIKVMLRCEPIIDGHQG